MNRPVFAILAVVGLFILSLIACRKSIEVEEPCRILSFESYENWSGQKDTITARFSYDDRLNPTSIIFNKNTTGRPNYYFKYDPDGKLIEMSGLWPNRKSFEFVFKIKYDANGDMTDSMYYSGSDTSDLMKLTWSLHVGKYTVDEKGRVIEREENIFFPMDMTIPPVYNTTKYGYDENGNRIKDGWITYYDDKVNLLSTHPVLQFLHSDYSVNNTRPAIKYNKHGLPLEYDSNLPHPFNQGVFMSVGVSKVVYSCD